MFRSISVRARERSRWTREPGNPDVRHRGGVPWDVVPIPYRWHVCRPQTVQLHRERGVLDGTYHCACGAVTDRTGAWRDRNSRRHRDPAGLCCDPKRRSPSVREWWRQRLRVTLPAATRVPTGQARHEQGDRRII